MSKINQRRAQTAANPPTIPLAFARQGLTPAALATLSATPEAQADGSIVIGPWRLSATGIVPVGPIAPDDIERFTKFLEQMRKASQWWLADHALNFAGQHGEKWDVLAQQTGYSQKTIANLAYVAKSIEISRRRENLSFSVHAEVAAQPPDLQTLYLDMAERERLTSRTLRARILGIEPPGRTSHPLVSRDIKARFGQVMQALSRGRPDMVNQLTFTLLRKWLEEAEKLWKDAAAEEGSDATEL